MHSVSLMRFLNVNHSVRLMKENERRFSLPKGQIFPRFGGAAEASKPMMTRDVVAAGGARLRHVHREPDIMDDYRSPAEQHGHGLGQWGEVLRRVFGGAPRE